MELNIRAGMRVLYKHDNKWNIGELAYSQNTVVNEKGLFLYIIPKEFIGMPEKDIPYLHDAEINDIFFEAHIVDEAWKDYNILLKKDEYIKIIEEEESFIKSIEKAYVSDGEYYYYPITKFNRTWLEKQPFDYVVRF